MRRRICDAARLTQELYVERLRGADFTDGEINIMCRDNTAALFGRPPLIRAAGKLT